MAFMVSKNQPSFSEQASEKMRFSEKEESTETIGSVSTQLSLKSSSHSLDRDVVLRRLRHHKTLNKVKNAFHSILSPSHVDAANPYDEKWLQRGDVFTSA